VLVAARPIHWRTYRRDLPDEAEPSQNHREEPFLAQLLERVSGEWPPVIVGDRAGGRASLMRWLQQREVGCVLRVAAAVRAQHAATVGACARYRSSGGSGAGAPTCCTARTA
jgi:hypothetical protein